MRKVLRFARILVVAGAFGCLCLAVACSRHVPSTSSPRGQPEHLILVTIDTLRADHVGAWRRGEVGRLAGTQSAASNTATPVLDRLAAAGVRFDQAMSPVPLTRPAHTALLSGFLPTRSGVRDNTTPATIPDLPLLAEVLAGQGFQAAAFVSSVVLSRAAGLDRGFAPYDDEIAGNSEDPSFLSRAQRNGAATIEQALAWMEANKESGKRLFVWLHLFEPHDPYEPPEPFRSRWAEDPYTGEIAYVDDLLGRLLDRIEGWGLRRRSLVVVAGDHGEGLGEHEEALHGFFVYQSTLHVPLLMSGPGVPGGVSIKETVGLIDVMPTVLALLGVADPLPARHGRNLATLWAPPSKGEPGDSGPQQARREIAYYAESLVPRLHFGWSDLRVVRGGRYKLIQAPRPELYDLTEDPGELRNLASELPQRVADLQAVLAGFLDDEHRALGAAEAPSSAAVPAALLQQLGALGYVGGGDRATTTTPGADPKDKIGEFRFANESIRAGLVALQAGRPIEARDALQAVLDRGVESAEIHGYLARAYGGLGNLAAADRHYQRATERSPQRFEFWIEWAQLWAQAGRLDRSDEVFTQALAALPREPKVHLARARLLRLMGRAAESVDGLLLVRAELTGKLAAESSAKGARTPGEPDTLFGGTTAAASAFGETRRQLAETEAMLGEARRDRGDAGAGVDSLRRAVELAPETASYWNLLAMSLSTLGDTEAEMAFRNAAQLDSSNARYSFNLALWLLRENRRTEARTWLEKTLVADPSFSAAREQLAALR